MFSQREMERNWIGLGAVMKFMSSLAILTNQSRGRRRKFNFLLVIGVKKIAAASVFPRQCGLAKHPAFPALNPEVGRGGVRAVAGQDVQHAQDA
jgi:hypothetical protein